MMQNALVIQAGSVYRALTDLTHELIGESHDAAAAIQTAIDALGAAGGTVTLGRGRFDLRAPVRLASRVWLRGSGRATRLVVAADNAEGIGVLASGAHGAVVSDMALRPAEWQAGVAGVVLDGCGDSEARDLFCAGFGQCGVWLRGSSFLCRVRGCSLAGNARANLLLEELRSGPYGSYVPNLVSGCTCYAGGAGIECRRAVAVNITGCVVHQSRGPAYHFHTRSNGGALVGSRSYQIGGDAVVVERSDELTLSGNTLCWHGDCGIVVRDSAWGAVTGNQIVDTGSGEAPDASGAALRDGIALYGASGYQISGNTIFNWGVAPPLRYGVWEDERGAGNSIVGNSVNYYAAGAVLAQGQGTLSRDNQGRGERPYNLPPGAALPPAELQRFQRELTEQFVALLTELEDQ